MFNRESVQTARSPQRGRPSGLLVCAALMTVMLTCSFAAMALASSSTAPSVGSATNAKFGEQIVVETHGRTLYALSPETTHHLLCKSSECLKFWPPLTVRTSNAKLKNGAGVHGHLAILRRAHKIFQVTLDGLPLYRFSGDSAKGETNGENVKSFGGTWHAISAATGAPMEPAMTETPPSSPAPTPTTTPNEKYSY